MNYDFTSKEREFGRVVFALTLDKKRMTERIVIARADDARMRLEIGNGEVFYDETRPLGSLLFTFEADRNGDWNRHGMFLRESYAKAFPRESVRWKIYILAVLGCQPVRQFAQIARKRGKSADLVSSVASLVGCGNTRH